MKYKKYVWLDYDTYKKLEISIIEENNKNLDAIALDNIISSFNILNINNNNINYHENENNIISEDIPENEEIEIESDINSLNNSISSELEFNNSSNIDKEDYKISNLYARLLSDDKFLKYKDLILDLQYDEKSKKLNKKNISLDNDSDDELLLNIIHFINKKNKKKFKK